MSNLLPTREERMAFLQERRQGIGGSDVAAICNLSPYKTPMDVYLDKVRAPEPEEADSIHLIRGRLLEDTFASLYAEESGRDIRRMGQREHPDYPFCRVNVDRQILDPGDGKGTGALEIKSPGRHSFQNLIEAGLPERYIVQVQWEMFVPGYDWGSFAAGNLEHNGGPLIYFDVERNDLLIEELLNRVKHFWTEHVEPRVPPDPAEWEPDPPSVPDTTGERVVVTAEEDPELVEAVRVCMRRYEMRKEAKELYREAKERVQGLMGEKTERIQVPGQGKVNYLWSEGRTSFKKDQLKRYGALDPDAVERFLREAFADRDPVLDVDSFIEGLREECALDFSIFESEGDPYRRFRPYPSKDRNEE